MGHLIYGDLVLGVLPGASGKALVEDQGRLSSGSVLEVGYGFVDGYSTFAELKAARLLESLGIHLTPDFGLNDSCVGFRVGSDQIGSLQYSFEADHVCYRD